MVQELVDQYADLLLEDMVHHENLLQFLLKGYWQHRSRLDRLGLDHLMWGPDSASGFPGHQVEPLSQEHHLKKNH